MPFYAVARGTKPGVYQTWDECKKQVDGYPNARYKKFKTQDEADKFIAEQGGFSSHPPKPVQNIASSTSSNIEISTVIRAEKKEFDMKALKNTGNADVKSLEFQADFSRKRKRASFDAKSFVIDDEGFVHVFTDGACESNGKRGAKAGFGVWFNDDHPLNTSEPVKGRPTNNSGEIQAAINAIEIASACGIEKLLIHTDSQFLINAATKWIHGWKRRGWKLADGTAVKNQEDFKNYVPGHKGIHGNEKADELARLGAKRYEL
ncbi:ribonuclease H1-like isoform X2 [Artemia franciscana]|uniref:ribonuclease H1-like isoform X2 n=1 Tax=Artemia franciscana TaxID=6661 RepID=UPI0032DABE4C